MHGFVVLSDWAKMKFEMERKQKVRIEFNCGLLPRLNPERPVLLDVTLLLVGIRVVKWDKEAGDIAIMRDDIFLL